MKYILHAFSYLCILTMAASCDKFTDIHKPFIEGGEIIYAVKPDSVVFIAGKERLLMRLWMENGQNIKNIIVSWNGGADSLIIPMKLKTGRDSIETLLPNLVEKAYSFNIYAVDGFGHRSLTYTQFGTTFGDAYAGSLQNRRLKKISLTETEGLLEWFAPAEGMILNEVKFINRRGTDTTVRFASSSFSVGIDAPGGTTFQYRSLYIPQSEAIDTFASAWASDKLPDFYTIDRSAWEALSVSDETASDGGGKDALIDGDLGSYWHSQWGPDIALPHWAIIDLSTVKNIAYFTVYRRKNNTNSKSVQLFLGNSSDPNGTWTLAGQGAFTSGDLLKIDNTANASGRYLKIYLADSNNPPFTSIAEIYAYGK
ncbi:DUF4998 domain-containing protein [Chitinophaga deserti]|uniref:DUF4998 domain-containing protein n=1 Tax=Chitinophaga deserti TaxID=2164099 RepID=UPI000D6C51A7|nr:DUF4998 domain-containing protein [Chitinophaga deserti]